MVMAISMFLHPKTNLLTVIVGYESGHAMVSQLTSPQIWNILYIAQSHTQPILSLDVSPEKDYFLTSSADAIIAKHPIHSSLENQITPVENLPQKTLQTGHAGQQGLRVRDDGKIFATAGWDARVRVYDAKAMKELAVLKWHKEGCYATSFADVEIGPAQAEASSANGALVERTGKLTVREERLRRTKMAHWLAVGAKDGKVSLWDIY